MHFEKKMKKSKTVLRSGCMLSGAGFDSAEARLVPPAASPHVAFENVNDGSMSDSTSHPRRKALPKKG